MATIGKQIISLKEVDSTNLYFMDWLTRERPEEGTVIIAEHQTAGRGADGSEWESEQAMNLTFSFVLYPHFLAPDAQFYLNKVVSLGLSDLMIELLPDRQDVKIKWPNDIYIGDHKIAGTLVQNGVKGSRFDYAVVGIGLNINQEIFRGDAANPVSLKVLTGNTYDLEDILNRTLAKLDRRYDLLQQGMRQAIDQDYLSQLYRLNQLADFEFKGKTVKAIINGVNRYGQLILHLPGEKIIECDLKEIRFVV
jgi:BirA family biotin operon repressor/biotin-[acetyl-CoA-carboxylase] ligase